MEHNTNPFEDKKNYYKANLELIKQLENPPKTLEECLKIFEKINYNSYGFPMFFLDYDYEIKKMWSVAFRNPANFDNPDTSDLDPLVSCHKMFKFLRERIMNGKIEKQV